MNVLFVLADQHNANLMGCAGHPQALTPRLDQFARESMQFNRAYCQNPICTPSRTSILSGQYCHNHGTFSLSGPAPLDLHNLFRHFKANGYRTAGYGKLHLPHAPRNWIAEDVDEFGDSYENAEGLLGKSDFLDYLEAEGVREKEDSWHNKWNYGSGSISHDAQPSMLPYEHTQEMWCARKAIEFIDQDRKKPFCIQVAFQKPHHPLLPQQRFWELYPEDLELPPTWNLEPTLRPPHFQKIWSEFREMTWDYAREGDTAESGPRRSWRGTLACISQIDDVFGHLLDALRERNLEEDTIVIYSSDHGAYHTIHGLPEKAPGICSDAVCRVPLIWKVPGKTQPGSSSDALVELVDITPTLVSLCGLPEFDSADGLDATPLLTGRAEQIRETAATENPWSKAIVWGPWRYVHYQRDMFGGQDIGELYHLENDPEERRNLYYDPQYKSIVEESRRRVLEWLICTTRVTASNKLHWEVTEGETRQGERRRYFTSSDGKAPTRLQPKNRDDNVQNYL